MSSSLQSRTRHTACTASKPPEQCITETSLQPWGGLNETPDRGSVCCPRVERRNGDGARPISEPAGQGDCALCAGRRYPTSSHVLSATRFREVTGQPFVVLNKPGAFGMLAIDEMVKAAPDGYTVMIGNVSTNAITPIIYANKMSFDYAKSVVAVTNLIDVPAFLLVNHSERFSGEIVR